MKLTVLGCSGSTPGTDGPSSSYLVTAGDTRIVLDLGSGAFGALQREVGLSSVADLDAVLLSHLHVDHCADVCALYVTLRYGLGASNKIPVYGPEEAQERLVAINGPVPGSGLPSLLRFLPFPDEKFMIGDLTVDVARVKHVGTAYAISVEHEGKTLVYSGDTGPAESLIDLAAGADVLLCEAAFHDGQEGVGSVHLTGREAGEHAQAAGVKKLIVTHVPPWGDRQETVRAAASAFDGVVEAAEPGKTWTI